MSIDRVIGKIGTWLEKNSGKILTGLSLVGLAGTTALAVKATTDILSADEEQRTKLFMAKKAAPVLGVGLATGACIVGAELINEKTVKSLTATAASLGASYGSYIAALKAKDPDAQKELDCEIAASEINWKNTEDQYTFILAGTQKPFVSNYTTMLEVQLDIRDLMDARGYFTLKDIYDDCCVTNFDTEFAENVGFNQDDLTLHGYIGSISFKFSDKVLDDGTKVIYVDFLAPKFKDFDEFDCIPRDATCVAYDILTPEFLA